MPYIANPLEGLPIRNSFITDQSLLGAAAALDDTIILYDISATALKQLTIANMQAGILASPAFTGTPTAPTQSAGNDTTRLATTAFVTAATTALNTVTEMTDVTISSIGSGEILKWNGSAWINQELAEANILTVAGPTFTGVLTVGSAVISEADLELIDDLTAGTVVVSKAVTVDGNKDVGTIRNLTIDGVFTDGNYTFATDGNVSGLGTVASGAITSSGIIKTDSTTNATSITDGSLQTDGGLSVTLDVILGDDLTLISDAAILNFGVNSDVNLTHVHDTGLLLNSSRKIQFGDAGTFIHQSADGVLTIESDTTVDINGAVVFGGALSGITTLASGTHTIGTLVLAAASITDTSGALSFGNENLSTTGTLAAGTTTIGTLTVAAASITDSSGALSFGNENLTTTGTLATAAITASGIVKTDDATEATSTTDGSLQTDGGLSVVKDAIFGDDVTLISDAAVLNFGLHSDVSLTHVADTALLLNSSRQLQFGDSGTYIHQSADGVLDLVSDTEIEINATTIDINGAVALNGAISGATDITLSGELDAATLDISGIVDIAGVLTMSGDKIDMSGEDIDNIRSATFIAEVNAGNGSADIDWGAGQKQYVTLSGNVTLDFVNPDGPCNLILKIIHSGGGRTVTWGDGSPDVKWPAGTAPTLSASAGTDIIAFYFDGSIYYGAASVAFA